MAVSSPVYKPIVGTGAKTLVIEETTTAAGLATITLPALTRSVVIRARTPCTLKLSTTNGGDYITVNPYCVLKLEGLELEGQNVYVISSVAITVIEALITQG